MNRALIAWEYEAVGIWKIRPPRDTTGASVEDLPHVIEVSERSRTFNELLSRPLLDRLRRWNDRGCSSGAPSRMTSGEDWIGFDGEGESLALAAQIELGDDWQVLWATNDGAWHFVRFP